MNPHPLALITLATLALLEGRAIAQTATPP